MQRRFFRQLFRRMFAILQETRTLWFSSRRGNDVHFRHGKVEWLLDVIYSLNLLYDFFLHLISDYICAFVLKYDISNVVSRQVINTRAYFKICSFEPSSPSRKTDTELIYRSRDFVTGNHEYLEIYDALNRPCHFRQQVAWQFIQHAVIARYLAMGSHALRRATLDLMGAYYTNSIKNVSRVLQTLILFSSCMSGTTSLRRFGWHSTVSYDRLSSFSPYFSLWTIYLHCRINVLLIVRVINLIYANLRLCPCNLLWQRNFITECYHSNHNGSHYEFVTIIVMIIGMEGCNWVAI